MATTIKHKRSSVSGNNPSAGDIDVGEIAINLADQKIFTKNTSNAVVELASDTTYTAGTGLTLAGTEFSLTDTNGKLNLTGGTLTGNLNITSTDASADANPEFTLFRNSASPADGDYLGQVKFEGKSDTGVTRLYAKITAKTSDVTNSSEDGLIETAIKSDGTNVIVSRQTGDALKLINGTNLEVAGNITVDGTVDGRDVAADGSKLDGVEASADVTDTTNVVAALTAGSNITIASDGTIASTASGSSMTDAEVKTAYENNSDTNAFTDADHTKLDGIEASADVTDTANVTAAGALMDSELTSEASVKALDQGVATTDSPTFASINVNGLVTSDDFQIDLGTTTAAAEITTPSSISGFQAFRVRNTHTDGTLAFGTTLGQARIQAYGAMGAADPLNIDVGSTTAIGIDATGQVGIGTTSPTQALTVSGNIQIQDDDGYLQFKDTNGGTNNKFRRIYNSQQTLYISRRNDDESLEANDVVIDSSGKVGIGTATPDEVLEVSGDVKSSGGNFGIYHFGETSDVTKIVGRDGSHGSLPNTMDFFTNSAQRMRIASSGNVSVGTNTAPTALTTSTDSSDTGVSMSGGGRLTLANNNSYPLALNRYTSEGSLINFLEAGVSRGTLGIKSNEIYIADGTAGLRMSGTGTNNVIPCSSSGVGTDNATDLGASGNRFDDIYATNGTIQTSDRNEKQDIAELSEAEQRVAVACKGLLRKFRWKSAVEEKGDNARIHFGIMAQDLQAAFEAEGLDAGDYAMFISTTWWETNEEVAAVEAVDAVYETQTDEEGNETQVLISEAIEAADGYTDVNHYWTEEEAPDTAVARTKMGVRYSQLLAFIIAAL